MSPTKTHNIKKPSLKSRISLSLYLNGINIILLALAAFVMAWQALVILEENKYRDVVLILYNDSQNLARNMATELVRIEGRLLSLDSTPKILRFDPITHSWLNRGGFTRESYSELDVAIPRDGLHARFTFTKLEGIV